MSLGFDDLIKFGDSDFDVIIEKNEADNQQRRIIKKEGLKYF